MPTYEYRCRDCGSTLEVVQSIHDAALTQCPDCQGSLRKVFSNVGVVFKGSGFYRTDNRSKARGSGNEAAKAQPAKAEKPESVKAEAGKSSGPKSSSDAAGSGTAASGQSAKPAASKAATPAAKS